MAKRKVGTIRRGILNLRLRVPAGVKLTAGETSTLIDVWKDDQKVLTENHTQLETASQAIARNINRIPEALQEVTLARTEAARYFKITKDPLKRREWARRLVVAERARVAIKGSQKRMVVMQDRVKTLVQDAVLEKRALDTRIAEAEAYAKMGSGLKLVGESLIDARFKVKANEIHFRDLELGIEDLDKVVKQVGEDSIMAEAKLILSGGKK